MCEEGEPRHRPRSSSTLQEHWCAAVADPTVAAVALAGAQVTTGSTDGPRGGEGPESNWWEVPEVSSPC